MNTTSLSCDRPFESVTAAARMGQIFVRFGTTVPIVTAMIEVRNARATPHRGQDTALLEARIRLYLKARERHRRDGRVTSETGS